MNLILGLAAITVFLLFGLSIFRDLSLTMIFNLDAFLIVVGGTTVAMFVGFPYKRVKDTVYDVIDTFKTRLDRNTVIRDIVDLARIYGRLDIRSVEDRMKDMEDDFLRRGTSLLINRNDNEDIKNILEREMMIRIMNYNFSQNLLKTVARLTPSFGLAGTVISLIRMFNNFQSIDGIASLMAVGLMSTLYGVILSSLLILPLCAKVKERAIISETLMNITIEGIIAVNNMEHPLKIEERLGGYNEEDESTVSGVENTFAVVRGSNTL
jgi:chemotaxis protein MotA